MIPISDDDSDRTLTTFIDYLLIAANTAALVLLRGMGANDRLTYAFSTVPGPGDGSGTGARSSRQ